MSYYTPFCVVDVEGNVAQISLNDTIKQILGPDIVVQLDEQTYVCAERDCVIASGRYGAARIPFPVSGELLDMSTRGSSGWIVKIILEDQEELQLLSIEPTPLEI